jgi:hypothetical protein
MADQLRRDVVKQRLHAILRGVFAGSPTQLKDIPKKSGESRAVKRKYGANTSGDNR